MHELTRRTYGSRATSRSLAGILAGLVLLLGACGGDDDSTPDEITAETATASPAAATPTDTPAVSPTATAGGTTYTVEAGDTALAIAIEFDVTLAELAEANGMSEAELNDLQIGQELQVPSTNP